MVPALVWAFILCAPADAGTISPESLLANLHRESQTQLPYNRVTLLYDLTIAETGIDPATSAAWSLEMYDLATHAPHELHWQQMNQAAGRKNALTVLSLTYPELAARHFLELEPSIAHQPYEDPRIDLARHLFPRLWDSQGQRSLSTILQFADFTSRGGQYPYIAIGHILPRLAKIDPSSAHSVWLDVVHRLDGERGIWRTPDDYMEFLRECWPVMSNDDRRLAVEAALAAIARGTDEPRAHQYAEYYLAERIVRLDSELLARVYDLLPFVDQVNPAWGHQLRQQHPTLANLPVPAVERAPWRSGVFAAPGRDNPDRIEAAFERHHLIFLRQWAADDPQRAAELAQKTKDPTRRNIALALVLPSYATIDRPQAETWRRQLNASIPVAKTTDELHFLVALTRANFALGHTKDGEQTTETALRLGEQLTSARDRKLPVYIADGADDLHDLADCYGEYRPTHLAQFVRRQSKNSDPELRLFLLTATARGASRHRPHYQEPN
ncbi:MAG TPA: hypothetical protein VGL53_23905 [Bryobacteraceae bacterium]|jgi:hypothetical protein